MTSKAVIILFGVVITTSMSLVIKPFALPALIPPVKGQLKANITLQEGREGGREVSAKLLLRPC